MANTDFSSSLERMKALMTHGAGDSLNIKSNVSETVIKSTEGADGKTYGIVREAQKYYLKESSDNGASFDYIGGIHEKHLNECSSYENATKKLELKIRGLNEDRNTGKVFETCKPVEQSEYIVEATADMRKEINRQREIMMGAAKIMNETSEFINKPKFKDPEGFGTATDPKKQGEPFQEEPEAYKGDIDPVSSKKTPKNAGEPFEKEAKSKEDKFDIEKTTKKQGFGEKAKDVLGNSVAAKTVSGGKVIKVTEAQLKEARKLISEGIFGDDDDYGYGDGDNDESDLLKSFNYDVDKMAGKRYKPTKNDLNDFQDEPEETFDQPEEEGEIEEGFMDNMKAGFNAAKSVGGKAVDAARNLGTNVKNTAVQGYNQSMQNSSAGNVQKIATQLKAELDNLNARTVKAGGQPLNMNSVIAALSNQLRGNNGVDTSRFRTENVDDESNEKLVNEITEAVLNVFGKAPNYQKPAFTTPAANGSLVDGTTEWDDESAKGDKPYGQKIGSSAPFTEPVKQKIGEGEIGEDADEVQQGKTPQAKPNLGKEGDKAPFDKSVQKNGDKIGKGNAVQQGETQQGEPSLGKKGDTKPFEKKADHAKGGVAESKEQILNRLAESIIADLKKK